MNRFRLLAIAMLLVSALWQAAPVSAVEAVVVQSTTTAQPTATPIFNDDFEAPALGANWSTAKAANGVLELNTNYHYSGAQSVFLGQKVAGVASASLVLALDLSGQTDVFLDFWLRRTGGIPGYTVRSVSISDNGGSTWKQVLDVTNASQSFSHHVIDITSVAAANGLTLNNQFRILFYYYGDGNGRAQASDGLAIDDLRLTQRTQEVVSFPLTQDTFEAATFQQGLYPQSAVGGSVEFNTDYYHSGVQSVFIGQKVAGVASASLVLALDLSGQKDVSLDFWLRRTGGIPGYTVRSVSISDNGGSTWKQVLDVTNASQSFSHHVIDITSVAAANGLTLNNQFRILFYYYGDGNGRAQASDGLAIDDLRLTQRTQEVVSFPLTQDTFEAATFQQGLYPQSANNGVVELNTNYPHSGVQSVFLGQKVAGVANAALFLALDLSGQKDVLMDFWARATGGTPGYTVRSVSISDNGGSTWKQVLDVTNASQSFSHHVIDITSVAAANGLTLNNQFRILFYYYGDGNGRAQASDGLAIDDLKLVQTSISGKVFNKAATAGNEVAGAAVEVCSTTNACQTITSNSDGSYGFGDLAAGDYTLRALPPANSNNQIGKLGPITLAANTPLAAQNIILPVATGTPDGTSITPRVAVIGGVPSIFWTSSVLLTQKGCAGGTATYQVTADGAVVRTGGLAEAPAGTFSAQLAPFFPLHGTIQTTVNVQCTTGPALSVVFNIWIDPSGLVVNTQGKPIADATVSLYQADDAAGQFALVPTGSAVMSPANRVNPMKSDANGAFGWDVVAGYYRVRAEKAGCTAPKSTQPYNETAVLTIPPPVTDLRVVLSCGEKGGQLFLPLATRGR